jgi:hypothetical protein
VDITFFRWHCVFGLKTLKLLFLLIICVGEISWAMPRSSTSGSSGDHFLFEPAVAYSAGVLTQSGVYDIATQVVSVEGRVGYKISDFTMGLSYMMGFGTGEQMSNKKDVKPTDMGLYLGYDLYWGFQLFASYLFSAKTKIQSSENSGDFSGTGTRFGVAYYDFFLGTLMVEMISRKYTKYDGSNLAKSIQDSTTSVALSFPF